MGHDAEAWFGRRTSHWRDWPLRQLMSARHSQATKISVVIPARYEERTVGTAELLQFTREDGALRRRPRLVPAAERPPARSVRAVAAR